jgi:hypothetical protein
VTEDGRRSLRRTVWQLMLIAVAPALTVAATANRLGKCPVDDSGCRTAANFLTKAIEVASPIGGWVQLGAMAALFAATFAANHFGRPTLLGRILGGWLIAFLFGGLLPLAPVLAIERLLPVSCAFPYGSCPAWGTDIGPAVRTAELSGWSLLVIGPVVGGLFLLYVATLCVVAFLTAAKVR